jgi:hypothetical protein
VFDNVGAGVAFGVALGTAIGVFFDSAGSGENR